MIMYETLREIVNRYDPMGIAEIDVDEYEPEIRAILERLEDGMSESELEKLIREVFEAYFFKDEEANEAYKKIAHDFYAVINKS